MKRAPKLCRFTTELAESYEPPPGWSWCVVCTADVRLLSDREASAGEVGRGVTCAGGVVCVECWQLGYRPGDKRERPQPPAPTPPAQLTLL